MRVRSWRRSVLAWGAGLVLLTSGCDVVAAASSGERRLTEWPAAASGVACELLDFDQVDRELGVRFDTAGGAHVDDTYTCALAQVGHDFPDLTLSLSPTAADDLIFTVSVAPDGSSVQEGLGVVGYRLALAAGDGHGPGLEFGWLSAKRRLLVLRFTFAAQTVPGQVTALEPKLLALAQRVEKQAPESR